MTIIEDVRKPRTGEPLHIPAVVLIRGPHPEQASHHTKDESSDLEAWKERVRQLKVQTYALYLAYRDPRVPWYAKTFAACVVGYVFSPIDLIPDFVPVLGYLDDLVLVPLGIALALRMIPAEVMEECRENATQILSQERPTNWIAGGIVIILWILLMGLSIVVVVRLIG